MYSFEQALIEVASLVNDFKANEQQYLNPSYSEADVRNDFINKFFIALGWDVRHETQKNPYEQEVRVEKPVQVAKAQKRADYSFSIAPNFRTVKFFVEAKKPSHALENKDYYFQTARYGWNANTPIAVLTDFEEFHIIDCRFRPDINDALNYKIEKFHYTDYADKEKFEKIYWLFSREAVIDSSIEKYADALPKPRGKKAKGLKAVTQTIDESFLVELDEIRNDLAKSFKKNNTHLSSEELTEATQRTIDRLVFIKFLEDKLIEPDHYVSEFVGPHPVFLSLARRGTKGEVDEKSDRNSAWAKFLRASRTLDAKYNGVVFKKSIIDSKSIIEPDDKTFSAICEELSHENTPYNFDAIPIHILGSIYERFLGKVVNATDKRVTIEEKPEVRKAGGVYYTPQYIVNYIVDNTVGKLIDGKTPKEIAKLRFADIACGSGSFLITVFERLLDYHKRWYIENPEQAKKDGCILLEGTYHLSLKQKTKILLNNVYGVDIDQQAVEVTQLSLYLKLLEDETTATANDSWVMFKEQLLPDLNKNIINGNSLIGEDINDGNLFDANERLKLKPMNFEDVFPDIIGNGGFDAIVGNPPYVIVFNDEIKKYLEDNYAVFQRNNDLYVAFIAKGLKIGKHKGLLSLITPNSFIKGDYFRALRLLLNNFRINEIVDFGSKLIFSSANVFTSIFNITNDAPNKTWVLKSDLNTFKSTMDSGSDIYVFKDSLIQKLDTFKKFDEFLLIKDVGYNYWSIGRGKQRGNSIGSRILYKGRKENLKDIPYLKGSNFNRYQIDEPTQFLRFNYDNFLNKNDIFRFTSQILETNPKIIYRQTSSSLIGMIETNGYHNDKTVHIIIPRTNYDFDLKYVLGLFNSKILNYYYSKSVEEEGRAFAQVKTINIKKLPFFVSEAENQQKIILLVTQMLDAKKQLQQTKTEGDKNYLQRKCETLDKQINELVYQLYGLTEEEIKIVEGSVV